MSRIILAEHGTRGNRRILVIRDKATQRTVAEWYVSGKPRRKFFPGTKEGEREARAWAAAWHRTPVGSAKAYTVREVWTAYWEARRDALRPRTQILYQQRFNRAELVLGRDTPADALTLHDMDRLWAKLVKSPSHPTGNAPNQVKGIVTVLKVVWRWAQSRELITRNRISLYSAPGGATNKALDIPEYRSEDADAILAALNPQHGPEWRASSLCLLLAEHGFRTNAALHLEWSDVDLEAGTITLRPEWDKMHKGWTRPLTFGGYSAVLTALAWRKRLGYEGRWIFFSGNYGAREKAGKPDAPLSYQALHTALRKAEARAGIEHKRYRAMHGFRRMAAGNVRQASGDAVLGMAWIGDTDMKQATKYLKEREDEMRGIADRQGVET